MRNIILIVCLWTTFMRCQSNNPPSSETNISIPPPQEVPLNVSLNMTKSSYSLGQPITLRFVLKNNSPEAVTFCKLNSPANGQNWSNCFRINDAKGDNIPFIGKEITHKGPATETNLVSIEGNGIRLYTIDIRPKYTLDKAGTYKIRFIGDQVNLLPNSLPAQFLIQ